MRSEDQLLQKHVYRRLQDHPLRLPEPDDNALYEPIYQTLAKMDPDQRDPVESLARHIQLTELESLQLFSGFKGAGKTTELFRLKTRLEQEGYLVLYANALDSIAPNGTLDISDLLLSIAGSFGDQLRDRAVLGKSLPMGSFWDVLHKESARFSLGGLNIAGINVKAEMKSSPAFRQRVQEAMQSRIAELKQEVDSYVESCVRAIGREAEHAGRQVVFLFDSLERIRGTRSNEREVLASVEQVFGDHLDKLKLPSVHAIYTVPPWLKFMPSGVLGPSRLVLLPSVRQWDRDSARTPYPPGDQVLLRVVERRLGSAENLKRIFGDASRIKPLIDHCGGHLRDLLRLVSEALADAPVLPIPDSSIAQAIAAVRRDYLPIYVEDARWLLQIDKTRGADPVRPGEDALRLTRMLDDHMVLYLRNGTEWYDVHPLLREEIANVVERNPGTNGG